VQADAKKLQAVIADMERQQGMIRWEIKSVKNESQEYSAMIKDID
jgi:hypothetical protein